MGQKQPKLIWVAPGINKLVVSGGLMVWLMKCTTFYTLHSKSVLQNVFWMFWTEENGRKGGGGLFEMRGKYYGK